MNRQQIITAFFFVLFVFVLYQLFLIFSPFFKIIFWAGILAFVFHPLHQRIVSIVQRKVNLAAGISTFIVILIVVPLAAIAALSIAREGIKLYDLAKQNVTAERISEFILYLRNFEPVDRLLNTLLSSEDFQSNIARYILSITKFVGNYAAKILALATKNILWLIIDTILIIFLLFFFFREGEKIPRGIADVLPMEPKNRQHILNKISETFSAVIRGQFVTASIQSVMAGSIFWFLGLPVPFFFGFLTFLSAMIPVTGAASVWVPFVIYLVIIKSFTKALILLVAGTFLISLIDNFLKPVLIGEKTGLPVLLIFFGILGGLKLYGLTGIFLGPVIITLFFALLKIYQEEYLR